METGLCDACLATLGFLYQSGWSLRHSLWALVDVLLGLEGRRIAVDKGVLDRSLLTALIY